MKFYLLVTDRLGCVVDVPDDIDGCDESAFG